jgi:hypothetical protein
MNLGLISIHYIDLILSIVTIILLIRLLNKSPKDIFITNMLVLPLVLMINIALFSFIYVIDSIDGVLFNINFYNWWSSFIRLQDIVTIFYLAVLVVRRGLKR